MKIIKLCRVTQNSNDTDNYPAAQVTSLGAPVDAMQIQPYGLTSRPPDKKSLGLMFNILGLEQNRAFIAFCAKLRKKGLLPGETVLENMLTKGYIYLKADGDLEISIPENLVETVKSITINASSDVTLNAPAGNVSVTGLAVSVVAPTTELSGSAQIGTGFGCNGAAPQTAVALPPDATNSATAITLVNAIKALLIANGQAS